MRAGSHSIGIRGSKNSPWQKARSLSIVIPLPAALEADGGVKEGEQGFTELCLSGEGRRALSPLRAAGGPA